MRLGILKDYKNISIVSEEHNQKDKPLASTFSVPEISDLPDHYTTARNEPSYDENITFSDIERSSPKKLPKPHSQAQAQEIDTLSEPELYYK